MDDHMLDRIREEIELCFMCATTYSKPGEYVMANGDKVEPKDTIDYKAAATLINAYNKMVKLYYKEEYVKEHLYKSVAIEYKRYCDEESNK